MIRLVTCLAVIASLAACASSGPRRASVPSDPALIQITDWKAGQYLNRYYGEEKTIYNSIKRNSPKPHGFTVERFFINKHLPKRRLVNDYTAKQQNAPRSLADYYIIDVVIEAALNNDNLPLYRMEIRPRNARLEEIDLPNLLTFYMGRGYRFPLPLEGAQVTETGGLRSDWIFCVSCFEEIRADMTRPIDFSDARFKRAFDTVDKTLPYWRKFIQTSPTKFHIPGVVGGFERVENNSYAGKFVSAPAFADTLRLADQYIGFDSANDAYANAQAALGQYRELRDDALPQGLNAVVDRACKLSGLGYRVPASPRTIREDMRWIEKQFAEDVRCVQKVVGDYDPSAYMMAYRAFVPEEERLAKRFGLRDYQRRYLPDPAKEVDVLDERMREHEKLARKQLATGPGWIESLYASGEATRPGSSSGVNYGAIVAGVMQNFQADMQRTNQRNAEFAAKINSMAQDSGSYGQSDPVTGSSITSYKATENNQASKTASPVSTSGTTAKNTANGDAERAAGQAQKEAEQARIAEERRQKRARQAELRTQLEAVQPRQGGLQGCVTVVDRIQRPGSSHFSSCSYKEPDRMSSVLVFHNSCGFPVNTYYRFGLDTGGEQESGEYQIKPGQKRKTVGHCGMMSYEYRYEETSDSVRKRRDAIRSASSADGQG